MSMNSFLIMWIRIYSGRIKRIEYVKGIAFIWYIFGSMTLVYLLLITKIPIPNSLEDINTIFLSIKSLWPLLPLYFLQVIFTLGLGVRRLKDMNINPAFILISFLPYLDLPFIIFLMLRKGEHHRNQYGEISQGKKNVIEIILNK